MSNNYAGMRRRFGDDEAGLHRCAERLIALRSALSTVRRHEGSLMLATFNIRDFDSNKFGFGPRKLESMYYLAEIISAFDLVAVQEISRDLTPLVNLMSILGPDWDYIVTDATEGRGGNGERMGFLYNRSGVYFRKIAGEVVLPEGQTIVGNNPVPEPKKTAKGNGQFARTPFLVAFASGWFRFNLCTVHIYYGSESGAGLRQRIDEIRKLVAFFARRQDSETRQRKKAVTDSGGKFAPGQTENYILLGDFNVVSPEHETMQALEDQGFTVPDAIKGDQINSSDPTRRPHFYDQIAVRVADPRFEVLSGGMFDVYDYVYRDEDIAAYETDLAQAQASIAKNKDKPPDPEEPGDTGADPLAFYHRWRTWQMSDHYPLWVEIKTDFTDEYLAGLARN
jgi:hypothetical protein